MINNTKVRTFVINKVNNKLFGISLTFVRVSRKFTRLNARRMSHSPGIVNQTPRSIRFVHCHIFLKKLRES